MDYHLFIKLHLSIFISALCVLLKAEASDSIFFLDSPGRPYFRPYHSENVIESNPISLSEVSAAVSVLLGFAPPPSLPVESSSKLDEVLLPNPFDRPRAVLMLEVKGVKDPSLFIDNSNSQVSSALRTKILLSSSKAEIQLPDEDEVSVVLLDEPLSLECDAACTDTELREFANWIGGSYVGTLESSDGELTIPLASGTSLYLHISKEADREFALGLASLVHNVKRAVEMHEDFAGSMQNPAELLMGCFTGIQALQDQYGPVGISEQGMELFLTTLSKLFDSLQVAYRGKIAGLVIFNEKPSPNSGLVLNAKSSTRSSRWLEEGSPESPIDLATLEMLLVRKVLAWITGIILLISTLIGIYFLVNMPLTRDTLLYSNVKLD
ncbi:putative type 1 membrane protein [Tasmannia lanceolata]|uniref:putative type 1 membrane protein n=1 Tax=Tasmannia lanceolata TaxID=3420 RepID=UPI004062F633